MSKMTSFRVIALALTMLMIIGMVNGRWLDLETYSTSVISYGVHNISHENPANLELRISNSSTSYGGKRCESLYRFLPCADTMPEGVFLMFLYTYLMVLGEEWSRKGSEALYVWIGADRKVGASVFRVLVALPKIVIFVVPGILSSASDAQNQVVFGVSMYAGSTVITLTLVCGISIIFSKHKLKNGSSPESDHQQDSSIKCLSLSFWTDTHVDIDEETGRIAVIMLLSLIPFAFVGLVSFMSTPAMTLIALIVSGVSLLVYFGYQVGHPWIRDRSLAYLKQENVRMRFLDYVKRLSKEVDLGDPDVECFRRAFDAADSDHNGAISHPELEDLIVKVFELEKDDHISKEAHKAEILEHFDIDKNGTIKWTEFQQGCTKWKNEENSSASAFRSIWNRVIHKQRSNLTTIQQIMPTILKKVHEKHEIVKENGNPDIKKIEGLFSRIDEHKNNFIRREDIKKFIETLHFEIKLDPDRVLDKLVKEFDADNNKSVDKKEFEAGFRKWIKKAINHDRSIKNPTEAIAKFEKDSWGKIDTPVKGVKPQASIMYVIFGVALMITITSAFITSVKQFSNAAHIPFLFTSFVMAPIALKAKMVIKALLNAQPPVRTNASWTFSEIYDELVMNNLLGLFSLLTILNIKGLSWTYSAEVFTIMIPCAIVGIFAFKRYNYPLWVSIPAILLYPVSVYVNYLLANV